ncbi:hypothetical protein [Niveispirillum sp. KHB5.9]|uniref:hypothetical protein n=1 Tax=Niveispirillum sp. KHB5.9 TaxID=3400269 RepID=UPI003A85EFDE
MDGAISWGAVLVGAVSGFILTDRIAIWRHSGRVSNIGLWIWGGALVAGTTAGAVLAAGLFAGLWSLPGLLSGMAGHRLIRALIQARR